MSKVVCTKLKDSAKSTGRCRHEWTRSNKCHYRVLERQRSLWSLQVKLRGLKLGKMPFRKCNYQVRGTADIPRIITEAVHITTTGRRSCCDCTQVNISSRDDFIYSPRINLPSYQPTSVQMAYQIKEENLETVSKTKNPVFVSRRRWHQVSRKLLRTQWLLNTKFQQSLVFGGKGTIGSHIPLFDGRHARFFHMLQ